MNKMIWASAAVILATMIIINDLVYSAIPVCGRDLVFAGAISGMIVALVKFRFPYSTNCEAISLVSILSVTMAFFAQKRLPDSWLYEQQELSRSLPVIELAWLIVAVALLYQLWKIGAARVGLVFLTAALIAGASPRLDELMSASALDGEVIAKNLLVDDSGIYSEFGWDWVRQNTDYNDVEYRLNEFIHSGSGKVFWEGVRLDTAENAYYAIYYENSEVWLEARADVHQANWGGTFAVLIALLTFLAGLYLMAYRGRMDNVKPCPEEQAAKHDDAA